MYKKLAFLPLVIVILSGSNFFDRLNAYPPQLTGNWWGHTSIKSLPQFVSLYLSDDVLALQYEKPRNCSVEARLVGQIPSRHEFRLARNSCEHMARLSPVIRLSLHGDRLRYQLTSRVGNRPVEVGYLRLDHWD